MGDAVIAILVAGFGGGGLGSIITACLNRKWQKDDRMDALINAQKVTMIDRVRHLSKVYITQGCITLEDKENLTEMYKCYKALGGNGHLDTPIKEIEKLKVVSEECP